MNETKMYSVDEVCKKLKISTWTLTNWYNWERRQIKEGVKNKCYLPKPIRLTGKKGQPRRWTDEMVEELKKYKATIVTGRNGIYGMYSNPYHKDTKKYKQSVETVEDK